MPKRHDPRHRSRPQRSLVSATPSAPTFSGEVVAGWLAQVPSVAASLRASTERTAMQAALAPFLTLDAEEQAGLTVALGNQRGEGANDALVVASALAELAPDRTAAKEARRATIRLRSAGARSDLVIPSAMPAVAPQESNVPPEFAGGWATPSRDSSEMTLLLCWKRPARADEIECFVLTLNFWQGETAFERHYVDLTLRRLERDILEPLRREDPLVEITIGQARALIEEAQDIRDWHHHTPAANWTEIESVLRRRVLNDDITLPESTGLRFITPDLSDEETLVNFWGAWSFGDFGLVYDLLSDRHGFRERATRDEFIALRRQWYDEAHPARFQIGAITPQTQEQSGLWLPGSTLSAGRKNLAIFWSTELQETPLAGQLDEMPLATLVNSDSSRHWYWQSVTMERDGDDHWRIGRIRDEAANAQAVPVEQLIQRSDELWQTAEGLASQVTPQEVRDDEEVRERSLQIMTLVQESLSTGEAALMRLPLDRSLHERLRDHARQVALWERAAALTQRMLTRFADKAAQLHELCMYDYQIANALAERGDEAGYLRWLEIALAAARSSAETDRTAEALVLWAEMLMAKGELDEAESLLRESLGQQESVGAWMDLGDLLMQREQHVPAVEAFERAHRLDPNGPQIRWRLARALEMADRVAEARLVYEDAIANDDNDAMAHALLGNLLLQQNEVDEAGPHLERALQLGLLSSQLLVQLASVRARHGNIEEARQLLTAAAEIDPSLAERLKPVQQQLREEEARQRHGKPARG